ncbi:MAG TPA: hypothetical protein VE078_16770 [Thermoanaerobaculia bacterium]|nr:hypothetical protein [Thermoanaerobaculia bacterium]
MTPELARADRAESVRDAARAWRQAGIVDETVTASVEARHPDDRTRVGPVFRVLLFLFTVVAVCGAFGFVAMLADFDDDGGTLAFLALLTGLAMVVGTELQLGRLRRREGGTEAATSFLAISFLLSAAAWWMLWSSSSEDWSRLALFALVAAALLAAAAWRWGYPLYAAAATAALFMAVAQLPGARLLWIVLPLATAPWLLRLERSPRLAPAHRTSLTVVAIVALAGLYIAVHLGSWEAHLIEEIGGYSSPAVFDSDALWWSAVAATALVPAILLAAGLLRRQYALILLGVGTSAVSLITLRYYIHLAPLWVVLTGSGALLVALALALRRYLASGPNGERHGYTAAPLFADLARQRVLEAGAAILALTPEARSLHAEPKFEGGGGELGGGGASGSF